MKYKNLLIALKDSILFNEKNTWIPKTCEYF